LPVTMALTKQRVLDLRLPGGETVDATYTECSPSRL
jgi:hypothetical protein